MGMQLTGVDAQTKAALEQYETAMQHFSQQQFEKAQRLLEKVRSGPSRELADRAAVHLRVCESRLRDQKPALKTGEEYYNYAIVLINHADYDQAEEYLERAVKMDGKTAYCAFALASLHALRNEIEPCLVQLKEAIALDPRCRMQARVDDDFRLLMDDPRFTEVLYPED